MQNTLQPLPMSKKELRAAGIEQPDFVLISGDAYVDHPSFGAAIIGRVLQANGYSVGVIAQPDWKNADAFRTLGRPKLAYLVTAGNLDSMVNHYSVSRHRRSTDVYSPGGKTGKRPDRAAIVYANRCKEAYKHVPVILGGLEASLRRFAHYDYWADSVRHSILIDSGADLLIYGMAERALVEVAEALAAGLSVGDITYIAGTAFHAGTLEKVYDYDCIESYQEVSANKQAYARAFWKQYCEQDSVSGKRLAQAHEKGFVVVNPPAMPLHERELDAVYDLPYTRKAHPSYQEPIPALAEVEFSLTSCRGCFGGCSFCALTFHQGRVVQSRSHRSLLQEAKRLTEANNFKGYIHDVGGPTANFRQPSCKKQRTSGACRGKQCIGYERCERLVVDHSDYIALLKKLRALSGVKKVFVRSGVRFDYVMYDKDKAFLRELAKHHISGQLKVAPEHVDDTVLFYMNKPKHEVYERFVQRYDAVNKELEKDQYIVPYFISSHPGSDLNAAIALAEYLKQSKQRPEQVQDFYPTPGTLATCMYHTGLDPRTMQPVYVARTQREKGLQRALMQYYLPQNHRKVREALVLAGREDLIGFDKRALVPPEREEAGKNPRSSTGRPAKKGSRSQKHGRRR
ncbi:YgiQ family radical SAM protein [Christensenellaceae bacterium OttesenSCG-928-L17]|nr:YgiQ family radical SAM protein [Christensenellaceae bacterium OttesenSCG-928-L17]